MHLRYLLLGSLVLERRLTSILEISLVILSQVVGLQKVQQRSTPLGLFKLALRVFPSNTPATQLFKACNSTGGPVVITSSSPRDASSCSSFTDSLPVQTLQFQSLLIAARVLHLTEKSYHLKGSSLDLGHNQFHSHCETLFGISIENKK